MVYDSEFRDGIFIHVVFTIVTPAIPLSLFLSTPLTVSLI